MPLFDTFINEYYNALIAIGGAFLFIAIVIGIVKTFVKLRGPARRI